MTTVVFVLLLAAVLLLVVLPTFRTSRKGLETVPVKLKRKPLQMHRLDPADRASVEEIWRSTWSWFRDDPRAAVGIIDRLALEVLKNAGYDMNGPADPDSILADYRIAHDITRRFIRGEATDVDLDEAMLYYTSVFEQVLHPDPTSLTGRAAA